MIQIQELIEFIEKAPFPETDRARLLRLAEIADEDGRKKVYLLTEKFVNLFRVHEAETIRKAGRDIKSFLLVKAEEVMQMSESASLQGMEKTLSTL